MSVDRLSPPGGTGDVLSPRGDPCGAQLTGELSCPGDPTQISAAVKDQTIGVQRGRHLRETEMSKEQKKTRLSSGG